MRRVFYLSVLVSALLSGCSHQSESKLTVGDCKDDDSITSVLNDINITTEDLNGGGTVEPSEDGESFHGLTCIAFNTLSADEVEIGVINFWLRCEHYEGVIDSFGRNNFQITCVDPNPSANSLCACPFDFTFSLDVEPSFQDLTVEVLFGGDDWDNSYHGYEAIFDISQQESGIQCWEAEWAEY